VAPATNSTRGDPRTAPAGRLRLRRRLTIAFVLVAGLSAAAVAVSSYLLVQQAWLDDSLRRADRDVRYQLVLAEQFLPLDEQRQASLLDSFARSDRDVVLVSDGGAAASNPAVDPPIPDRLRDGVAAGQLAYQRVVALPAGDLLLVGGRIGGSPAQLYVVYSEDRIHDDLAELRTVLLTGALAVTLVAALVGYALARRTLEPVGRAAAAAQAVAAGLLDTRLPVAGTDEFGAWAVSFNRMAEALETKIEALSQAQERERRFTADVAHELRTPVTALVAEASLLREHLPELPADARRPAELLVADVVRLRQLVDALMEISRLDGGQEVVRDQQVDLAAVVRAVIAARGWGEQVRFDAAPVMVHTDPRRLERVLANLITNAVEHGGSGVEVRLGPAGPAAVRVDVVDRGPGIAPEHLPYLFDRFYKADPARASAGSGLGLAIARENARLLGAGIEVRSEPGAGTEFRVTLPVTGLLPGGEAAVGQETDPREGGIP
jgi:two-component system sensor histidine kinase MtrB